MFESAAFHAVSIDLRLNSPQHFPQSRSYEARILEESVRTVHGIPRASALQFQWSDAERSRVDPPGLNLSRDIGITCSGPLLIRLHRNDFPRRQFPKTLGVQCYALIAPAAP
jgi:hypothetical protein